ncbi:receptor-like protein 6 [Macadamia integrifolia]|uniref:receptor-like protein 6 n=1 Tax=Macadamia integrifolia TaxID=60698 RepID=UPI001C531A81|nr:receptor-like protein 6 [Macadamia integrifolia]
MLWWCFFIFLLSLFQTCFLSSPSSSPQLCHPEERYALLQLKQKHYHVHPYPNYDPDYSWFYPSSKYRSLKSWKSNTDCCYWEGIICDGTTGHVVGLELSDSSLNGSIYSNSSLFHLRHLQMLNLSWNAFDYFTPSGFDRLSRLRHLNLSGNSFSGPIPSQISQLTDLFSLDLSFNNFVGQIPSEISRLTKLVFLDLSSERTTITSEGYFTEMYEYQQLEIPNFGGFVQNLSSLKELHLDRVNLSGPKNRDWCHQLSSALPNLHVLSLSDCALTGPLDASISSLRFLSELYLGSNQGLFSIVPSSLVNLTSLTVFSIWGCDFYGDFPSNVFLQPWVTHIDLSDNLLLSVHLPEFLQINNTLQYLCADGTDLQGKLPSSVGNLKSLKILRFSGCNLFGLIPPSLANLTHLTALDLSFNNLSGQIPSIFKESFSNLEVLRLGKNLLQGHIHSYLFFLPSLRILDLFLNRFSGVITEPIHNISSSFSSPRVFDFDLGGNYLKGEELMRPISKIKGTFKSLELSFNDFFNASGDYFFNAQIHDLGMRVCNLSKFPNFLRNQKELTSLDLSSNRIDGAIPKWIWKLQNLSSLDLSNNSFTGLELPLPTNHSFNIISLHLGSNMIHDSLPIASCSPQTFNQSNSDQFVSPILGNLTSLFSKAALYFSI